MRKRQWYKGHRRSRDGQHRDVVVSTAALDFYRVAYGKNKGVMDLLVELYGHIYAVVKKVEKEFKKGNINHTGEIRVKLKKLKYPFEIAAYIDDYSNTKRRTFITIHVKQTTIRVNCKKIEEELAERFLRGDK
jgi:hypothetical protein